MIELYIVGSQSVEARLEFLDMHMEANIDWSLEQINGTQVVHYGSYGFDEGRIWVSGPYLIWLYGHVMEQEVWFDTFVELYLAQPPIPGVGTLLDWLRDKPFEPAPSGRPDFITTGLPEGFEVESTDFETGALPSGETIQSSTIRYLIPPDDEVGELWDWIEVHMYAFGSAAGRSEFLDMLVTSGELSPERRDWSLVQVSGGQVALYKQYGWDSGRIWISGPYLIMVEKIMEEHGPWMETFTELYLAQYPAE